MTLTGSWRRAGKVLRRGPRSALQRVALEIARQGRRPWSRLRPLLLTDRALLRLAASPSVDALWERLMAAPFFVSARQRETWARRFLDGFPEASRDVLRAAEAVLRHEFDLLGSGPVALGDRLPWHVDFKTGHRWPLRYGCDFDLDDFESPSDVKVPWELSRCQHFITLGQAYWVSGDERWADELVAQLEDWIDENPWGYGVNWAGPMDVALRAISWIWGLHFMAESQACGRRDFRARLLRALFLHGEFLAASREIDEVDGNHYLVDAVGLVFLGLFFRDTKPGGIWLETGKRMLLEANANQIHEDGVGIEQSIAYHRLVLEAFLAAGLLLERYGEPVPKAFWERLERMHEFVLAYAKPNGQAPLIGDADDGRVQKLGLQPANDHRYLLSTGAVIFGRGDFKRASARFWEESFWLLGPDAMAAYETLAPADASPTSQAFPAGGFYVLRNEAAHLIVDCGEVGLRGLGGHGHNDVLSFELHFQGANLVTDCGAYLYTASKTWRNLFRSSSCHNTVEIDGEELNRFRHPDEIWRLHYDARPRDVLWRPAGEWQYLRAGHRGYERLPSPATHIRALLLHRRDPVVLVHDRILGAGTHRLVWRFHLDPAVDATIEGSAIRLRVGERRSWLTVLRGAGLVFRLEPGWVSPSYGVKTAATVLYAEVRRELPVDVVCAFTDKPPDSAAQADYLRAIGSFNLG